MLIDIYMKYCEDSLNGFQTVEQTRREKTQSIKARVMVLALSMSSKVD